MSTICEPATTAVVALGHRGVFLDGLECGTWSAIIEWCCVFCSGAGKSLARRRGGGEVC